MKGGKLEKSTEICESNDKCNGDKKVDRCAGTVLKISNAYGHRLET